MDKSAATNPPYSPSENIIKKGRNASLELLRIIAMLMIITLHINGHGLLLELSTQNIVCSLLLSILQSIAVTGVNVYILITGYFLCESDYKPGKLLALWLQTFFYSATICLLMKFTGLSYVRNEDLFKALIPVSYNQYWFVTCYFALYLCIPILNIVISKQGEKGLRNSIIVLVCLFSIQDTFTPLVDTFLVNSGCTFFWFSLLYLVGAYIKKYSKTLSAKKNIVIFASCVLINTLSRLTFLWIITKYSSLEGILSPNYFLGYNSITVLISSITLFCLFIQVRVSGKASKYIVSLATTTFGVYLIHDNKFVRPLLWDGLLNTTSFSINLLLPFRVIFTVAVVFIVCAVIDCLRLKVENLLIGKTLQKKILMVNNYYQDKMGGGG